MDAEARYCFDVYGYYVYRNALGIDELIGGAMNGQLLGNVQPYRDVVERGIAELAALHASLRVP